MCIGDRIEKVRDRLYYYPHDEIHDLVSAYIEIADMELDEDKATWAIERAEELLGNNSDTPVIKNYAIVQYYLGDSSGRPIPQRIAKQLAMKDGRFLRVENYVDYDTELPTTVDEHEIHSGDTVWVKGHSLYQAVVSGWTENKIFFDQPCLEGYVGAKLSTVYHNKPDEETT